MTGCSLVGETRDIYSVRCTCQFIFDFLGLQPLYGKYSSLSSEQYPLLSRLQLTAF